MKNWKDTAKEFCYNVMEYIDDPSEIIKITDNKLMILNSDQQFKKSYKYYKEIDSNIESYIFKNNNDDLLISFYDSIDLKTKTKYYDRLLLFYFILEKIFLNVKLYKYYFRSDSISYHYIVDSKSVFIQNIKFHDFALILEDNKQTFLTGNDLIISTVLDILNIQQKDIKLELV